MSDTDSEHEYTSADIDSDDDFINCYDCEIEVDVAEVYFYKKYKLCEDCKEMYERMDEQLKEHQKKQLEQELFVKVHVVLPYNIAKPVRMVYKKCENISFSCCGRRNCIQIKCYGNIKGHHINLYSCDPELVNYQGLVDKINCNHHGDVCISEPFEETNLLRGLRIKKTERLNEFKEKEKEIKLKNVYDK